MSRIIFIVFLFLASLVQSAYAASFGAGFRSMGDWSDEDKRRMDLLVWYPTTKGEREVSMSPWTLYGSPGAKCATGKFPLLVISHFTPGGRFSYHELAAFFARRGYVVVAPTHPRDNLDNMDDIYTWRQLLRRAENIDQAIDLALDMPDVKESLDREKIGFIGFGAGATTGLLLGGAAPNCANWQSYCARAGNGDVYCQKWTKDRIDDMCDGLPLDEKVANPRVKASALVGPAYGMMFDQYSFSDYAPETLLVGIVGDKGDSPIAQSESIARAMGKKAFYYELKDADMGALTSACPSFLASEMPDLCLSVPPETRQRLRDELASALATFFDRYLPASP